MLLGHVTEYELLTDRPELALTLLRAVGRISRDVHRYRAEPAGPQTPTPGAAEPGPVRGLEATGLSVEGEGVVLSSLRRRDDWLELRLVCQRPRPSTATVGGEVVAAREADLLGRPGPELPVTGGGLRLELGAWEIRTVQLRLGPVFPPVSGAGNLAVTPDQAEEAP